MLLLSKENQSSTKEMRSLREGWEGRRGAVVAGIERRGEKGWRGGDQRGGDKESETNKHTHTKKKKEKKAERRTRQRQLQSQSRREERGV